MKQMVLGCFIAFLGALLVIPDADARRLGGKKSFGRSTPSALQQRQSAAPSQAARPNTAANSGARRWLGPLAGLAAGGLLAAMFFGDGFSGLQLFDILIFAGLLFGGIWLFRSMRRNAARPMMQRQAAAAGNVSPPPDVSPVSSALGESAATDVNAGDVLEGRQRPKWFNEQEFLQGAKTHFIRLQAAWDNGDMKDIREYTTPELFAQLTLERQSYGGEKQFTEVITLNAELLGLVREGDQIVASVQYSGLIREEENSEAEEFSEVWHVQRAEAQGNADWYIAGVEQTRF
jgi:predicted lipid-binding transport protein (Tim44 family)